MDCLGSAALADINNLVIPELKQVVRRFLSGPTSATPYIAFRARSRPDTKRLICLVKRHQSKRLEYILCRATYHLDVKGVTVNLTVDGDGLDT